MAKITKNETLNLTRAQAVSLIKNADGKVRFTVYLRGWLPVDEETGFDGMTCISISRTDAIRAVEGMLTNSLEERGAKIQIKTSAPSYDGGLSFITIG